MAYYPADFVDRIKLIKQLQEERFMPLKVIKGMLDEDPDRAKALVELEDRILERALAGEERRTSVAEVKRLYEMPGEVLERLEELGVLNPEHPRLLAIRREDRGGDQPLPRRRLRRAARLHRLRHAALQSVLAPLVKEEVEVLMERLVGEMETDDAVELIEAGSRAAAGADRARCTASCSSPSCRSSAPRRGSITRARRAAPSRPGLGQAQTAG